MEIVSQQCSFDIIMEFLKKQPELVNPAISQFQEYLQNIMIKCFTIPKDLDEHANWLENFDFTVCGDKVRSNFSLLDKGALSLCRKKYEIQTGQFYNEALDDLISKTKFFDYRVVPAVFVHDKLVRGQLSGQTTAAAVCDSMKEKPFSCNFLHQKMLKDNKDILKAALVYEDHSVLFLYLLGVGIVAFCIYSFFKHYFESKVEQDLQERAGAIVSSYHRMKDDSFTHETKTGIEII